MLIALSALAPFRASPCEVIKFKHEGKYYAALRGLAPKQRRAQAPRWQGNAQALLDAALAQNKGYAEWLGC